jgi:D-alanyl-D-alanine carboxypeptidase/D-alanyl-D-alanine-endopeptidase (penicillin-binding protein 4)
MKSSCRRLLAGARPLSYTLLAAALAVSVGAASYAAASGSENSVARLLSGKGVMDVQQSVLAVRLSDGKALFEKDADKSLSPASVTKVITAAAALARFSPVRTFKTRFYSAGPRKNDRVLGDLVIVGDGDPFVISEKLWQVAADLKNLGIREFTGDVVIDNGLFDDQVRDHSRQGFAKGSHNAYDAPVTAFGVNFNTYAIAIAPSDQPGRAAHVSLDPYPLRGVVIENNVKTAKARAAKQIDVKRVGDGKANGERLVASGVIAADAPMSKVYRSVGEPVRAAGEYVKAFLKAEGVIVKGDVRQGPRPADAQPLLELEGYEVRRIVQGLNTFSNNFIADMMVKRLGAAFPKAGSPEVAGSGSYGNGIATVIDFLRKDVGLKGEFTLLNGSGLDTGNRLTARQVTEVLAYMERRMDLFPDFVASFPATGWDGTLKKRFGKGDAQDFKGMIRAKTGTLTEPITVAGLAGYFRHPKHGLVAFCILENGKSGEVQPAVTDLRDRQDEVLVAMLSEI